MLGLSQLTPMLLTSILVVHFFFGLCTHFTPRLVLLCIAITTDLSSDKTFFLKAVVHAKRSDDGKTSK
jgi:hypothetical protein